MKKQMILGPLKTPQLWKYIHMPTPSHKKTMIGHPGDDPGDLVQRSEFSYTTQQDMRLPFSVSRTIFLKGL